MFFFHYRSEHLDSVKKPTIHRLVTPEGFQLSTNTDSIPKFWQSHFGSSKEFKKPLQQQSTTINNHHNKIGESLDVPPVSRTRFSRATRSPLKYELDTLPINDCDSNGLREDNIDKSFTETGASMKNSFGNKHRCKTCNKVSISLVS